MLSKNYEIIHDRSKNLEQYDITLNKMINNSEEVFFKETEITTIKFPLKLTGVSQIDSKDSPGVQLADVLVGGDLSPDFKTMTKMRFPVNLTGWRSQHEEAIQRRTNHQGHQRA